MKDRENSIPEKKSTKIKCVKLRSRWEFVRTRGAVGFSLDNAPFVAGFARDDGRVSGRYKYRYTVSTVKSKREKPAAVANGFAATVVTVDNAAPSAGPNVKAMQKHAPIRAIVAPRCLSSLMSVAMAVASCIFPSLKPPTTLLARKVRKSVAATHSATEARFPAIDHNNAVRRPYLSDRVPMIGDAIAWRKEKRDPSAPPRRTMS